MRYLTYLGKGRGPAKAASGPTTSISITAEITNFTIVLSESRGRPLGGHKIRDMSRNHSNRADRTQRQPAWRPQSIIYNAKTSGWTRVGAAGRLERPVFDPAPFLPERQINQVYKTNIILPTWGMAGASESCKKLTRAAKPFSHFFLHRAQRAQRGQSLQFLSRQR